MIRLRSRIPWRLLLGLLLGLSALLSVCVILGSPGEAPAWPMDQSFARVDLRLYWAIDHWEFHYPRLQDAGGIAASVTVGLYKLVVPTEEPTLNWHVRSLGAIAFLVSALLLIVSLVRDWPTRVVAFALVATSGFQLLQPSSELIAGAYFCLFLTAILRRWHVLPGALFLVAFGLSKVELAPAACVAALIWVRFVSARERWVIAGSLAAWAGALVAPSLLVNGSGALDGARAFSSLSQHYSALVAPHQACGQCLADPWSSSATAMQAVFPNAQSTMQVIVGYPRQYFDFLALSMVQSLSSALYVLKAMVLPLALLLSHRREIAKPSLPLAIAVGTVAAALLPALAVAFIHVRYVARFFPVVVGLLLANCSKLWPREEYAASIPRWLAASLLTILWQALEFGRLAAGSDSF